MKKFDVVQVKIDEKGQSAVLLAFMLVGILAFVGLAVDVGFIYARQAQFKSAVDAAALAGVQELGEGLDVASDRAEQFLGTNGWPTASATSYISRTVTDKFGVPSFAITLTWPIEVYFMRIIGFESIEVTHSANALFSAKADIYTTTAAEQGMIRKGSQFIFGPESCTNGGDMISPLRSGSSTVNPTYPTTDGLYHYRIRISDAYEVDAGTSLVWVELFDPDPYNVIQGNAVAGIHSNDYGVGAFSTTCATAGNGDACVAETGENPALLTQNPYWFTRVDESWTSGCDTVGPNGIADLNTVTRYTLYYLDDDSMPVDIADYIGNSYLTDMQWILPPGFAVDINTIPTDEFGFRYIYLDVNTTNGFTKNVWDLRAGPPHSLPADVNLRNLDLANNPSLGNTYGVATFASGFMPFNSWVAGRSIDLPLSSLDSRMGGGAAFVSMFDADNGTSVASSRFYINTNPNPTTALPTLNYGCMSSNSCNNKWITPFASIPIRGVNDASPEVFYGGVLTTNYTPNGDEHVWSVFLTDGRPRLED